ncbi:response regulator transcription factor [bacterium]|nr:response regulator transcription factor [bacterium]
MKAIIIDDDKELCLSLKKFLKTKNYTTDFFNEPEKGISEILLGNYDFLLLDYALPKMNGKTVCERIRRENKKIPIILISIINETDNKVSLLNSGADHYLKKPFSSSELWAVIKSAKRRSDNPIKEKESIIKERGITINPNTLTINYKNKNLKLNSKEFDIIYYFYLNKNRIISRQELLENIWDYNANIFSKTVDVHVSIIRKKIKLLKIPFLIKTIPNKGYCFFS